MCPLRGQSLESRLAAQRSVRRAPEMNTLSLEVAVEFEDDKKVHVFCDARVDGTAVADPLRHSISLAELRESAVASGPCYLITCSCGNAGCAGIEKPVEVTHSGSTIEWNISEPAPQRHFSFEAEAYRSVIQEAMRSFPLATAKIERVTSKQASPTPRGEEEFFWGGHRAV